MRRVDIYPTHKCGKYNIRAGKPIPFGASIVSGGINFSVYSRHATSCELVLFNKGDKTPFAVIPFMDEFRIGNVFCMIVFDLNYETIEYGYRMDGPFNPKEGHWFDKSIILTDPYAKAIGGRDIWKGKLDPKSIYTHRSRVAFYDFNWDGDRPLEIPMEELIIYEMHVRGFTKDPSSDVKHPGTYSAIREKIPHLKDLGINCVELMPIQAFDEYENERTSPETGETLLNYWGYSTLGFFAPKAGYAASGKYGMEIDELKALIKDLHNNGIEVILDVVYNHTAEGNEKGPYISFRGLDNKIYYMLTADGHYYNFSGCGNTMNCNNPIVRSMILDSLRYWVSEYHIDGFRFDLASILGRNQDGSPMPNPPLLEALAYDPVLGRCKLIAEAWDAGGLYQVGSFPSWGRWAEWNGKFRDDVRKFIKGDECMVGAMVQRIQGSPDMYRWKGIGTCSSINFITCHDGFTLYDLFTYNKKYNEANGEDNRDGCNDNFSWNCGFEGPTNDREILFIRKKLMKNAICILMASHGVPMMLAGDEIGKTQKGNNNAYCQDNELSWINWHDKEKNRDIYDFFKKMIAFRKAHPIMRRDTHFDHEAYIDFGCGYSEISWHGLKVNQPDWSYHSRTLAMLLCDKQGGNGGVKKDYIYIAMNMHWVQHKFELPRLSEGREWYLFANTNLLPPNDISEVGKEKKLRAQKAILIAPRTIVILIGR